MVNGRKDTYFGKLSLPLNKHVSEYWTSQRYSEPGWQKSGFKSLLESVAIYTNVLIPKKIIELVILENLDHVR